MKRLSALLVTAFALSGCGLIAAQRQFVDQEALRQANMIVAECRQRRLAGELKSNAESVRCSNDRVRQVIAESGYPYMDLVDLQLAYRLAVAQREDEGKITHEEVGLLIAELNVQLENEARRRAMVAYQVDQHQQQAQQAAWQNAISMMNDNLQREADRNALTAPTTMPPITCQQFGNMIQCH